MTNWGKPQRKLFNKNSKAKINPNIKSTTGSNSEAAHTFQSFITQNLSRE